MCVNELPENYELIKSINLVNDKRSARIVNAVSVAIIIFMLIIGILVYGKNKLASLLLLNDRVDAWLLILRVVLIALLCMGYVVLHELVHAAFMKLFCKGTKLKFGYKFSFAYVSGNAYYSKKPYYLIVVAPLVLFGTILAILCAVVPISWFWTFYVLQIYNFSVAAGDIFLFFIMIKLPKDVLIKDGGTHMEVYAKADT